MSLNATILCALIAVMHSFRHRIDLVSDLVLQEQEENGNRATRGDKGQAGVQVNVSCDVCSASGNLWNAWQRAFKQLGGTASSAARSSSTFGSSRAARSSIYKDWKDGCQCNVVRSRMRSGVKLAMGPACVVVVGRDFVQAETQNVNRCSQFDKHVDNSTGLVRFQDRISGLCLSWQSDPSATPYTIVPGKQGLGAIDCNHPGMLQTFSAGSGQYCLAENVAHASGFCLFSSEGQHPFTVNIVPELCISKVFAAAEYDEINIGEDQPLKPILESYAARYKIPLDKLRFLVDGERIGQQTPRSIEMESEDALDVFFEQGTPDAKEYHRLCGM